MHRVIYDSGVGILDFGRLLARGLIGYGALIDAVRSNI